LIFIEASCISTVESPHPYANSYTHGDIKPADTLVQAVAMLAFGCLGLASVDKIWGKKEGENTEE
jgi:hypothetical protein